VGRGGGRAIQELLPSMEKLQKEVVSLRSTPAAVAGGGGGEGGGGAPGMQAMTVEEKRSLSLNINKLDNEHRIQATRRVLRRVLRCVLQLVNQRWRRVLRRVPFYSVASAAEMGSGHAVLRQHRQ
jgi:hypothetical protein